jgi:5-methylcytosine-specific restriction endonuclease McrA
MVSKPCKHCGGENHLSFRCFHSPPNWKKKQGKTSIQWLQTRRQWFREHKADSYNCYYCGRFLLRNEVELDHYHPRSGNPELRYDLDNLRISCHPCNFDKGSIDGDLYIKKIKGRS